MHHHAIHQTFLRKKKKQLSHGVSLAHLLAGVVNVLVGATRTRKASKIQSRVTFNASAPLIELLHLRNAEP